MKKAPTKEYLLWLRNRNRETSCLLMEHGHREVNTTYLMNESPREGAMTLNLTFPNAGFSGSTTPWGFASATGMGVECRGSRVAPYSVTPEANGPNSLDSAGKIASISAMPHYSHRTHEELRLEDYELCNGFPGTTSHNGSSFPIQNQGNAFQQSSSLLGPGPATVPSSQSIFGSLGEGNAFQQSNSPLGSRPAPVPSSQSSFGSLGGGNAFQQTNSLFGPRPALVPSSQSYFGSLGGGNAFQQSNSHFGPVPVPSSQSSVGSLSGPTFGTATASLVSDSSVKPLFGSTCVSPVLFGREFVDRDPRSHASEASSTQMSGFNSRPATLPSSSTHGSTTSIFGMSNTPHFAPSSASSNSGTSIFRFPSASAPEGPNFSAFKISTTPGLGITSTPSSSPTFPSVSSFFSGPKSNSNTVVPGTSNNPVSTTSGFSFSSMPAGIQTSSGSLGTTAAKYQGSGVASYYATKEVDVSKDRYCEMTFHSISAMPSYNDKSHEELRSEDYGLGNTGGHKLQLSGTSSVEASGTPNQSSVHSPFSMFKSNFSGPNTETFRTPSTTISAAPTLFPSVNPLCCTNVSSSQSQAFTPQPTTTSLRPTLTYQPSLIPFTEPIHKSSYDCSDISTTITSTYAPLSNQSSVHSPFQPSKSSFSELKRGNFLTPSNTISSALTLSPSVNPICCTNAFPYQSQAFTLQPATASFMPAFSPNLNQPSLSPFTEPVLRNNCESSKIPTTFTSSASGAFSLEKPSVIVSPSIHCTSLTASDPWPFNVNASQPQHTMENVISASTKDLNKPFQASSGLTTVEFTSPNIKGQQYVPSSTLSLESSLVVNPFATQFPVDQPNAVTSRQHGISSLPVSNNLSSNRSTSLLRIRNVSSRNPGSSTQKTNGRCRETKVPFFINEEDRPLPVAPFMPRENPRAWVNVSLSLCSRQDSKGDEVKDKSSAFQVSENSTSLTYQHEDDVAARTERHVADVLALLPKLPDGDYYTEPSLHELAAKEMAEAGWCSHVKDFVVGRKGYGSIKFLGETDVRHLDIKSVVQFNNREMIVYPDETKKPQVGEHLNKAAEVSMLNVKCINTKTGEQYVEGHQVERYQEMLITKTVQQGAKFVSYDPLEGEWKFRVQHF